MGKIDTRTIHKKKIYELFKVVGKSELTTSDIAKVLDYSRSQWLRNMLYEMVEDGVLIMSAEPYRQTFRVKFALNPDLKKSGK